MLTLMSFKKMKSLILLMLSAPSIYTQFITYIYLEFSLTEYVLRILTVVSLLLCPG